MSSQLTCQPVSVIVVSKLHYCSNPVFDHVGCVSSSLLQSLIVVQTQISVMLTCEPVSATSGSCENSTEVGPTTVEPSEKLIMCFSGRVTEA